MIKEANSHLQSLFDKLVKALIPDNRSGINAFTNLKKTIVSLCYIMFGMRNKFINDFKLKVRLYLSASEATRVAINIMNSIKFSAYYIIVNNFKRKLVDNHSLNI